MVNVLSTIFSCFDLILTAFRSITINIGGINISLFLLVFGIYLFAMLCRTYLKYLFDLPTKVNVNSHNSLTEYINSYGEIYKVVKSRWY